MAKNEIISHLDLNSFKLMQSISHCISNMLSPEKISTKKNLTSDSMMDVIREYLIVYLQSYTRYKN